MRKRNGKICKTRTLLGKKRTRTHTHTKQVANDESRKNNGTKLEILINAIMGRKRTVFEKNYANLYCGSRGVRRKKRKENLAAKNGRKTHQTEKERVSVWGIRKQCARK